MPTIAAMLAEAAAALPEPFSAAQISRWFRDHYPAVKETSLRAHIQALTGNATNRLQNAPVLGARPPVLFRIDHGLYRRWRPEDHLNVGAAPPSVPEVRPTMPSPPTPDRTPADAREEWSWEGNVQAALIGHLAAAGWRIRRVADTRSKEHGTDVVAQRDGRVLHVEVKGWPSRKYVDPARAHEAKKTPPLQARVWFGDALLHGMRLRSEHPTDDVALCLPDTGTYRRLATVILLALTHARLRLLLVSENGAVEDVSAEELS